MKIAEINTVNAINEDSLIGDIVALNYKSASVFGSYGVDFCCKGNRTIKEVCIQNDISPTELIDRLNQSLTGESSGEAIPFHQWPLDLLIEYIIKVHHNYVIEQAPVLQKFLDKICMVHGKNHPELLEITELFYASIQELNTHMAKEEQILFPLISQLYQSSDEIDLHTSKEKLKEIINAMKADHDKEGDRFRKIEALTGGYMAPEDACTTYTIAFEMLKDFESDLHKHIHLENNILFPKGLSMGIQTCSIN